MIFHIHCRLSTFLMLICEILKGGGAPPWLAPKKIEIRDSIHFGPKFVLFLSKIKNIFSTHSGSVCAPMSLCRGVSLPPLPPGTGCPRLQPT